MKINLPKCVKLDGDYTNHSIRATVISTLDREGFEACHIISLSSHKNESSIKEYATDCPDNKRKEMFDTLKSALNPKAKKVKSSTVSSPDNVTDLADVKENLPHFNLEPVDQFETINDEELQKIIQEADKIIDNLVTTKTDENSKPKNQSEGTVQQQPLQPNQNINRTPVPQQNIVNTVSTVNNVVRPPFPAQNPMYFPNSSVTINYNYYYKP